MIKEIGCLRKTVSSVLLNLVFILTHKRMIWYLEIYQVDDLSKMLTDHKRGLGQSIGVLARAADLRYEGQVSSNITGLNFSVNLS